MDRRDLQWWAGATSAAVFGVIVGGTVPHPWDARLTMIAAALMGFSAYKITPGDSVKKDP